MCENSVQDPLLLRLLLVGLKKQCLHLSQQITLHTVIFIVSHSKFHNVLMSQYFLGQLKYVQARIQLCSIVFELDDRAKSDIVPKATWFTVSSSKKYKLGSQLNNATSS